jgi:hypothetical protein
VLLVVLSAYAVIDLVATINRADVRQRLVDVVPARTIGVILIAFSLATIAQDGGGAVATTFASGHVAEPMPRHVWTADLAIGVPATLAGGVLLWRRTPLGYTVATGLLLAFGLTPIALAAARYSPG